MIFINNIDSKLIDELECIQEVEYIYKNYHKIDDLKEVLTFKTNHNFIKYMSFDIYSIFDIVNNLNSDNDVIIKLLLILIKKIIYMIILFVYILIYLDIMMNYIINV